MYLQLIFHLVSICCCSIHKLQVVLHADEVEFYIRERQLLHVEELRHRSA